jgi:hypothetical protein
MCEFGMFFQYGRTAGSHNNINMLQRSNVFQKLVEGTAPPMKFEINDHQYDEGIYPRSTSSNVFFSKSLLKALLKPYA